jgi:crotonobetainyl-CoA:carnitine CoA-transferase CaiB-like acyl-CoA transferase
MQAVMAILAALVGRASTGTGAYLDVSVADGMLALMALQVDEYLATGDRPGYRTGVTSGRWACYDTYRARDGKWLSVAAIEHRFWRNLCAQLGLDEWADHQTDDAVQGEVRADLRRVFATKTRDEWVAQLAPADTCVAPVLTVDEVVDDPQYAARHAFVAATHPSHGAMRQVAPVFAGMARQSDPYALREGDVTDTDTLLADAGMSSDDIAKLRDAGVIA